MHIGGRFTELFAFAQDRFAVRPRKGSAEELFEPAQLFLRALKQ